MANPNTIPWTKYQDIQTLDAELKNQFDSLMSSGNYKDALVLLRNNKEKLNGKTFASDAIMKIVSGIKFLQSQFNDAVPVFLSDLATQYFALVEELGNSGEWLDYIQYQPYNFVKYNNDIYMSISQSNIGEPPAENEYWVKLSLKGENGTVGVNVSMEFFWNENQDYKAFDLVVYKDNIYVAVKDNNGIVPSTDETTWKIFVSIIKGKFNVGTNPPEDPEQNTIWFKTDVDPLVDTIGVIGQIYRYKIDGVWEKMYPATFFALIGGIERYAPIAFRETVRIPINQWKILNGRYSASYENYRIKDSSFIEISCDSDVSEWHYKEYCHLEISVGDGFIKFTMPFKPTQDPMVLNIAIQ